MSRENHSIDANQRQEVSIEELFESINEQLRQMYDETVDIMDEAKAKANAIKDTINQQVFDILSAMEPGSDNQLLMASLFYWFGKPYVRVNNIAHAVGLKHGNLVYQWVLPATVTKICRMCGREFPSPLGSRTHNGVIQWECDDCLQEKHEATLRKMQDHKEELEAQRERVKDLRAMPYPEYLQTEHWHSVRKAALKRSGYRCQVCNTNEKTLHVHHRTYENRGQENANDVTVLCEDCHRTFHEIGQSKDNGAA